MDRHQHHPGTVHLIRDITAHKQVESLVEKLVGAVEYARTVAGSPERQESLRTQLSQREQQILRHLSTGKTTAEIAHELSISAATARNHTHNILSKLGVRNRLEAVTLGLKIGLL